MIEIDKASARKELHQYFTKQRDKYNRVYLFDPKDMNEFSCNLLKFLVEENVWGNIANPLYDFDWLTEKAEQILDVKLG